MSIRLTQIQTPDKAVIIVLHLLMDLVIIEGSKNRRRSRLVVFYSLVNFSLRMPRRIGTTMYELVEPVMIQFHTDDRLCEVVQEMMQLQMTSHIE